MCDEKCAAEALALLDAEEIRDLRKKAASNIVWLDGLSISTVEVLEAYLSLTDPETGELANLRSQNRDLQQVYDHVLECEQNRCREVVELQDRLAEVTADRVEERENSRILRASRDEETAIADAWMRKCNELEQQLDKMKNQKELDDYHILKLQGVLEGSTKRNRHKRETINGLHRQLDELRRRIDDAPVWYMEHGGFVSVYAASFRTDKQRLTRVRLVRDDQLGETDA